MIKNCVFHLPNDSRENIVEKFNLKFVLENDRTSIFQNEEMRFCIDKRVVRVMIFDRDNEKLLEKLRNYFYGEEYERL